jgi:hypothetical protein
MSGIMVAIMEKAKQTRRRTDSPASFCRNSSEKMQYRFTSSTR